LFDYQNSYVECSNWLLECLNISLSKMFKHNYFDDSIQLFLHLYPTKFLDISARSFRVHITMKKIFFNRNFAELIFNRSNR